jgi:hypothetical protein
VFKPFDLQQLLAMISQEASDLHWTSIKNPCMVDGNDERNNPV